MSVTRTQKLSSYLSLQDPDYTSILTGKYMKPRAYVEIVDTDSSVTTLSTCTSFSVTIDRDELSGSFSCEIEKARDWNPRNTAYLNLLNPDKRKRINIYFGQKVGGAFDYLQVFKGVLTEKPETYSFGGSDKIALSGSSLAYLLLSANGTYKETGVIANHYGYSKQLLKYWLDEESIGYDLSYEDGMFFNDVAINYSNALAGLNAIKQVIGPNTDCYFDALGRLIYRDLPQTAWSANDVEFAYTASNILSIEKKIETSKITTVVDVSGDSASAVSSKEASAAMITQYGRNSKAVSSGYITTAAQADTLAQDVLDEGARWVNPFSFTVKLNPYITIGSFLTVIDSSLSDTVLTQVRVKKINHVYGATRADTTAIEAFPE